MNPYMCALIWLLGLSIPVVFREFSQHENQFEPADKVWDHIFFAHATTEQTKYYQQERNTNETSFSPNHLCKLITRFLFGDKIHT